jgi:hypothetical protein
MPKLRTSCPPAFPLAESDFGDYYTRLAKMEAEAKEYWARDPQTNVTDDDFLATAKIALAHLKEFPTP